MTRQERILRALGVFHIGDRVIFNSFVYDGDVVGTIIAKSNYGFAIRSPLGGIYHRLARDISYVDDES